MSQQQNSAVLAVSVLIVGLVLIFIGISAAGSSSDDGTELPKAEIDSQDQSLTDTGEYVELVEQDSQKIKIEGRLSDGFSGGTVVVNSVENDNGEVRVNLSVERPEAGNTVITGYQYESTIRTEETVRSLVVLHGGDEFTVIGEERNQDDVKVDIDNQGVSDKFSEKAEIMSRSEDSITVNGRILAEQAGEDVVIDNYEHEDGVLTVDLDTVAPDDDRFYPQIVQYISYGLDIKSDQVNLSDSDLVVKHINGEQYNLGMEEPSEKNPTAEIDEQEANAQLGQEYADVSMTDEVATIRGVIVGNTGGQTVYINSVEVRGGNTYVDVSLESADGFATQVITGYRYKATVKHPIGDVVVLHDSEEVDGRTPIDILDPDRGTGERIVDSNFVTTPSKQDTIGKIVEDTGRNIVLEGSFLTGSSTCSEAGLSSLEYDSGVLRIELEPNVIDSEGLCTEDIAPSGYRLDLELDNRPDRIDINTVQNNFENKMKSIELEPR